MASFPVKETLVKVKPLVSSNQNEAKRSVLNLFKAWCREIPHMTYEYSIPLSYEESVNKIKQEFLKNKNIKDIRVIDMIVLHSKNDLYDVKRRIRSDSQFYYKFSKILSKQPPKEFLSKFLEGSD